MPSDEFLRTTVRWVSVCFADSMYDRGARTIEQWEAELPESVLLNRPSI